MKALRKLLNLEFLPQSPDFGLLLLRLTLGGSMLWFHGRDKLMKFSSLASGFPDPLHIGSKASSGLIVFAEVACAALLVLGFFTRFAAAGLAIAMGVAFFIIHKGRFSEGEMSFLYFAGFLAVLFAGPGKFALDGKGGGSKGSAPKAPKPKDK